MAKELNEIASRIRELREVCGYTVEQLAEEIGVDVDTYKSYETIGDNIPISVIYEIANKFGVDFTEIVTGVNAKLDTYHIVKKGMGKNVSRYPGYRFQDLAYRYSRKIMQPLLVTLDPVSYTHLMRASYVVDLPLKILSNAFFITSASSGCEK